MLGLVLLVTFFFVVNSWMLYRIQDSVRIGGMQVKFLKVTSSKLSIQAKKLITRTFEKKRAILI